MLVERLKQQKQSLEQKKKRSNYEKKRDEIKKLGFRTVNNNNIHFVRPEPEIEYQWTILTLNRNVDHLNCFNLFCKSEFLELVVK